MKVLTSMAFIVTVSASSVGSRKAPANLGVVAHSTLDDFRRTPCELPSLPCIAWPRAERGLSGCGDLQPYLEDL